MSPYMAHDIGREPDDGLPDALLDIECPNCGSTDIESDDMGGAYCLECGEWIPIGPDPFDYPEY